MTSLFNKDRLTKEDVMLRNSYYKSGGEGMLSKKKQMITWIVWLFVSPALFYIAFKETASIELFRDTSYYIFILLGVLVSLFPFNIKSTTLFLINSVSLSTFLIYGVFAEMLMASIAVVVLMIKIGVNKEDNYRYPVNILMFQILSIVSAEVYYLLDPILPSALNYSYNLLSLAVYLFTFITLNRIILYVVQTFWYRTDYGKILSFEYLFDLFSLFYTIPIAIIIIYLKELYFTSGIIIAMIPLVAMSVIIKLYFISDTQNQYLAEINELAVKLTGKQTIKEIIELYLKSWVNIFPADTIYFYTLTDDSQLLKTYEYHKGKEVIVKSDKSSSFKKSALETWLTDELVVYGNSKEWDEQIQDELDYPAESVLVLPVKRAGKSVGLLMTTDSQRNAYNQNMMAMIPILHNYLNIALENAYNFEKLQTHSSTDHLTGLSNLRAFEKDLDQYTRKHPDAYQTIIIIDLDHFKRVNDTYGHQAGNELLKQVAILLSTFVYEQEKLARYGGEEFIFFIPNKSPIEAFALAEEIRSKIEESVFNTHNYLSGRELIQINITASIGLATYPHQCSNTKDLMTLADRAMYVGSKQKGRNKVASLHEGKELDTSEELEPETVF